MKVLVTGGAGFIGSHVVEQLLKRGEVVTVVDDFNDFYNPAVKRRNLAGVAGRCRVVEADIRDAAKLQTLIQPGSFDAIIHLAARAGVRPSLEQPQLYTEVNILGTQILLELARQAGIRKFVFASSSSVYGVNQKVPFKETDSIFKPISPYAATKLAGEALAHVYHHLYAMDIVCLRFFTVYGPRQRPDLAIHHFTRAILDGKTIALFGDGSTARDYTYIDDIVTGVLAALDRPLGYKVINLGGSKTTKLIDLVRLIEKATGRQARIEWKPTQPGDVPITYADVRRAEKLLDYRPTVPVAEGLRRFVAWCQSRQT